MQVVYEDNHIIIVAKRSGEIVQGDKTGDTPLSDLVKAYIKERYQKPGEVFLGVPHRLDRPVSGLVVFARTSKALTRLNAMFAQGEVHKSYWAIVEKGRSGVQEFRSSGVQEFRSSGVQEFLRPCGSKRPEVERGSSGVQELVHWLTRNEQQNKAYAHLKEVPHSKLARLQYRLLAIGDHYDLVEVQLLTGRHHQIRCQLAAIGHPIKGDLKYGARRSNPDGSISLLARHVEFVHPVSKQVISVDAPLPEDPLWERLGRMANEK